MVAIKSEYFKEGKAEDFNKILQRQKKDESDPKFAISDSLQEYQQQLEISAGYQDQMKIDKANIRQDIVNFVIDYTVGDLDQLKGMDFDDAKTQQKTTEKTIKEYEGLHKKDIISDEELIYIRETVGKTNAQLGKILGLSTKLSLAFRDFKKELKPLKLARRIGLTNVPIIGKRIERAIESEERAESKALATKRQLRRKEAKGAIKSGGSSAGLGLGDLGGPADKEDLAKRATRDLFGEGETPKGPGYDKETAVEEERESDKQFDTSSGLLERILEESELTNELLGKEQKEGGKKERSLLSKLLMPLAALTGLGAIMSSSIGLLGTTLGNSMSTLYQGTRSLLGLGPKKPTVPPHIKNKGKVPLKSPRTVPPLVAKDTAAKVKTKDLVAKNVKKGANVAGKAVKGIARVGGRIFLPLAAAMSIFDAASGVANAGELLGKEDEELTFRDKASAGFAGFLSGLTFGLVDKEKMAKKFAGDSTNIDQLTSTELNSRQNLYSDHPMSKIKKVEEIKVDTIDKISTKSDGAAQTTIIKQGDTVNQENKTVFDGATIGTSVPDGKMYHDIP